MKFLAHIQEIDAIIDARKEKEYEKTLFGETGSLAAGVGLGAASATYMPNIHNGHDIYVNGIRVGHTMRDMNTGRVDVFDR